MKASEILQEQIDAIYHYKDAITEPSDELEKIQYAVTQYGCSIALQHLHNAYNMIKLNEESEERNNVQRTTSMGD